MSGPPEPDFLFDKKILVTGGTGFIGSHLVTEILRGNPARLVVATAGGNTELIHPVRDRVEIRPYRSLEEFLPIVDQLGADYVFLLGGNADPRLSVRDPAEDFRRNVAFHFGLLESLRRADQSRTRLVYISSVAVYGATSGTLSEHDETSPISPYGLSKLVVEKYVRLYASQFGLKTCSVRLFSTYGPRLRKQVVFDFITALREDPRVLTIRGDGAEVRDLSYITDQVEGILKIARNGDCNGDVVNLGTGNGVSVIDLARRISELMGLCPRIVVQPEQAERHHGKVWVANIERARLLGHRPVVSLDEGLRRTIDWVGTC